MLSVRLQDTNAIQILQPFLENVETLREACLDKKDAAGKVLLVSGSLPDMVHVFAKQPRFEALAFIDLGTDGKGIRGVCHQKGPAKRCRRSPDVAAGEGH